MPLRIHGICMRDRLDLGHYVCGYNYDFDPKIEIFGMGDPEMGNGKWEIGTYSLVLHPVTYGLWRTVLTCVTIKN